MKKAYRWLYVQLCWASVEQACSDKPMPWYSRLARRALPAPR